MLPSARRGWAQHVWGGKPVPRCLLGQLIPSHLISLPTGSLVPNFWQSWGMNSATLQARLSPYVVLRVQLGNKDSPKKVTPWLVMLLRSGWSEQLHGERFNFAS